MAAVWISFPLLCVLAAALYRLKFHPLSHVKGPIFAAFSPIFLYIICYFGIEGRVTRYYHGKYKTKVLRVGPNSVSISDSAAMHEIYIANGGFAKDARYANFNMGPVVSIFSAIDVEYRNRRAKAVAPLFSPARLRKASEPDGVIGCCVGEFTDQLRSLKSARLKVDILDLCARCSIDVVTGYLLGEQYGGLREDVELRIVQREDKKLSANPFIFAIVGFARFSLLPHWLFQYVYTISSRLNSSDQVTRSLKKLDDFAKQVTSRSLAAKQEHPTARNDPTYQERLLEVGIEQSEAATQAQATIFAGADSTALVLATIIFHLVQNPAVRARLLSEIRTEQSGKPVASADTNQSSDEGHLLAGTESSYLRAVVKEGLRLGMANPTRLTRVVPIRGLRVGNVSLPPGTIVGCAAYILHHDPAVFPEPFKFRPERWLEDGQDHHGLQRLEMARHMMPFGAGLRACIGKNLAQQQLHEAVRAVVDSEVLDGANTCQERIELKEWFNAEIKDHVLDIIWS